MPNSKLAAINDLPNEILDEIFAAVLENLHNEGWTELSDVLSLARLKLFSMRAQEALDKSCIVLTNLAMAQQVSEELAKRVRMVTVQQEGDNAPVSYVIDVDGSSSDQKLSFELCQCVSLGPVFQANPCTRQIFHEQCCAEVPSSQQGMCKRLVSSYTTHERREHSYTCPMVPEGQL